MRDVISEVVVAKHDGDEQLVNDRIRMTDPLSFANQTYLSSEIDHLAMDTRTNPLHADHIRPKKDD
jgi:hypothetical protein